jgi:hypothetical protein
MGKIKYQTPAPKFRLSGGIYYEIGGRAGTRTLEEKRALFTHPQAENIIRKFGGAREMARVLKEIFPEDHYNPSSIYRWTYPKEAGGTGGEIPTAALKMVVKAARIAGILLTPQDLFPKV